MVELVLLCWFGVDVGNGFEYVMVWFGMLFIVCEFDVIWLILSGCLNKEVVSKLDILVEMVKVYWCNIYVKFVINL